MKDKVLKLLQEIILITRCIKEENRTSERLKSQCNRIEDLSNAIVDEIKFIINQANELPDNQENTLPIQNAALQLLDRAYFIIDNRVIHWHEDYERWCNDIIKIQKSKKKKYDDLAEKRALTIPVIMWRFCAYKTEEDYGSGDHYFMKDFLSHTQMKTFSAKHSVNEKPRHNNYCSMYWKIETNATNTLNIC